MQRRQFISSTLSASLMSRMSPAFARAAANQQFDFVIIGAGTAGLPAAIFAARRNAKVLLIDAASVVGGTLHLANGQVSAGGTALQKAKGIVDTPDKHFDDIMAVSRGKADRNVARLTADHAPATIDWLLAAGLTPLPDHPVTGDSPGRPAYTTPRYLWAEQEGRAILAVIEKELAPELASGRVTALLDTRVTQLLTAADGAVIGARASHAGETHDYHGRHVLLTTGGYAMNPDLFQRLIGAPAYASGSYPFSQGDGLRLATGAGSTTRGRELHRAGGGSILTSEQFPAKVYARFTTTPQTRTPWEIWVNEAGARFVREDEPLTYNRERALAAQKNFRYAIVFDEAIFQAAPPGIAGWTREKMAEHFGAHPMFHRADTLDDLAAKARINVEGLRASVTAYNTGVKTGRDAFGRAHLPRAIAKPPYYAVIHLGHSATSSIGVTVDARLRVTRADGTPIPGLRAAGEVLGSGATLGDAFVPGMMLTPALSLGRWLGRTLPV
jgi:fumarate reductase flavoprotein subunit